MSESYWSLDDAINGFVAAMRARPYIVQNSVQVEDSWPGELAHQRTIWVDEAKSIEEVAGMRAGPIKYNEVYSLFVVCDSYKEGGATSVARAEITPLVGEVLREIAETKRIETPDNKVLAARVAGWRYDPYVLKDGRGVACKIEIKVTGRR
jgi:hypothetical protein